MKLRLLFIVILLCIAGGASADDADRLIADFDRKADVASANKFFEFLDRREFTDSKIVFSKAVPADSLRQQTWYWAAEWYYDCQNYSLARDYAKRALPLMRWPNLDKSYCLNLLGIIHVRLGDFKTAVEYAKRCVDIDIRLNDPDRVSSSLNTLAGAYMAANHRRMSNATSCAGLNMPSVPAILRVRQCCLGWLPKFIINLAITASRSIMPTVPTALIPSEGARRRWQCVCLRRAPRLSV